MTDILSLNRIENPEARIILCLAVMLAAGFLITRITKKLRLPNVSGYILAGVIIGPYALHIIPAELIADMDFVTDIANALIAFSVGKYLKISKLRQNARHVLGITLGETLLAAAAVTLAMYFLFRYDWPFALLLGVLAAATSTSSTVMTIRQYKAKGRFVNILLQVIAIDNAIAILAFSIVATLLRFSQSGGAMDWQVFAAPLLYNLILLVLGGLAGVLLTKIITPARTIDHMLALALAIIGILAGVGAMMNTSALLSCMVLGMVYINLGGDKRLFKLVSRFSPPILLIFYVLSGMKLSLPALATAGVAGVAYFAIRIFGKYGGAWLGAAVSGAPKEVQRYVGLPLFPQAGVSFGLAALGQRILPAEAGVLLSTIILSSGLLYQMVGPVCAKLALTRSGAIPQPRGVPTAAAAAVYDPQHSETTAYEMTEDQEEGEPI